MCLTSAFLVQRAKHPNQTALHQDDRALSYAEFDDRARAVAALLVHSSIRPGERVAVALDRGIESAVCIYGILYAGACYVPLDVMNPESRLRAIVDDAGIRVVMGAGGRPGWLHEDIEWLDCAQTAPALDAFVPHSTDPEALAAILYTSGSSGQPKGIALSHRAMTAFADWAGRTFNVTRNDRIASLAPLHFDLSVFELFTSLRFGASVDFIPGRLTLMPARLSAWLDERAITCWYTVPSILSFLAYKGQLRQRSLKALSRLLFAGEVFPMRPLIQLTAQLAHVEFYNLYGPTETNVCCYWCVDRARLNPARAVPIGVAAASAQLRQDPTSGELLVRGPSLMSGYWSNGGLESAFDEKGWYPTGDRVSLNQKGEFLYHGRFDRMLKCSGYRVEPGEIEASLARFPGVRHCAVVGVTDAAGVQRPVAAVVLDGAVDLAGLMHSLKGQLPGYMLPSRVVPCARLPALSSGKIDYQSLENALGNRPE